MAWEQRRRGEAVLALSQDQADLEDAAAVAAWVAAFRPEAVINCAAWTRVDDCEANPELAFRVNGAAVAHAASAAAAAGAAFVQVSTDYVFDGRSASPTTRTPSRRRSPSTARASSPVSDRRWPLTPGRSSCGRAGSSARAARTSSIPFCGLIERGQRQLRVVGDQVGAPTHASALARAILDLLDRRAAGLVHFRGRDPVSWADFARAIVEESDPDVEVVTVTTAEFPRPAARPAYSVLAVGRAERLLGRRVTPWRLGLWEHLESTRQDRRH